MYSVNKNSSTIPLQFVHGFTGFQGFDADFPGLDWCAKNEVKHPLEKRC